MVWWLLCSYDVLDDADRIRAGSITSSIKYNNFKEGKAINTKIPAGIKVQTISISVPSVVVIFIRRHQIGAETTEKFQRELN